MEYQTLFDKNSHKLQNLQIEFKHHMMSNYFKNRDLVMRVSAELQAMEAPLVYLSENPEFYFHSEDAVQPMLPKNLKIKPTFINHAIEIIDARQKQKYIFQ